MPIALALLPVTGPVSIWHDPPKPLGWGAVPPVRQNGTAWLCHEDSYRTVTPPQPLCGDNSAMAISMARNRYWNDLATGGPGVRLLEEHGRRPTNASLQGPGLWRSGQPEGRRLSSSILSWLSSLSTGCLTPLIQTPSEEQQEPQTTPCGHFLCVSPRLHTQFCPLTGAFSAPRVPAVLCPECRAAVVATRIGLLCSQCAWGRFRPEDCLPSRLEVDHATVQGPGEDSSKGGNVPRSRILV